MKALARLLVLSALAAFTVASRCNVPGELGPCGAYRKSCGDSLGGCCGEEDDCVADGCEYRPNVFGAGRDAGASERRITPRVRP